MEKSLNTPKYSLSRQALYTLLTVTAAVILPQIAHLIGILTGTGAVIGQILMPMYLPVLLLGFCVGPVAGAAAGILSPIVSFAVSGMPNSALLPFMVIELFCFGLFSGILRGVKINTYLKVLAVLLIGRGVRFAAVAVGIYLFKSNSLSLQSTLNIIVIGIPGAVLQLLSVPYLSRKIGRCEL